MATSSSVKPGTANEQNKNTSKALKQYQSRRKIPFSRFVSSKTPSRVGGLIYRVAPVLTLASLPRTSERLGISLLGSCIEGEADAEEQVTFVRLNRVPQVHGHEKTHPLSEPRSRHTFHGTLSVPISPEHGHAALGVTATTVVGKRQLPVG